MMRKIYRFGFIAMLCLCTTYASAQTISGVIADTTNKKNVANAVVAILKPGDSILYKFTRTDANGAFVMPNAKPGKYILMVTHPYFADLIDDVTVTEQGLDLKQVSFTPKSKLLQEVIIKTGSPIRIKGDTVTYTADSFKVSANANVEELLRKLPGIQVDKSGTIKAMGETVSKVLVDGEEFFGDDPGMAVKNLRADAVKEVQVFDKKSDQAEFTGVDDGQTKKTINLKLKDEAKKGFFGKAEVSGGLQKKIDNRYNNNFLVNAFKGKRKVAAYLLQGNTGQAGLNWQEQQKYGGDDDVQMGMDEDGGGFISVNRGSDEDPYIDTRNGFFENLNTGIQYSNKWNDKQTLNLSPKFNRQQYFNNKNTFTQYQSGTTLFNTRADEFTTASKRNFKNSLTYEAKIDSANTLKITTKLNFYENESRVAGNSINTDENGVVNNTSENQTRINSDKTSFSNSILYKHKFKKDRRTFSVNTDFNLLNTSSIVYLYSVNNLVKIGRIDSIDQRKNNDNNNKKFLARGVYTEPLGKKYSLELNYEFSLLGGKNDITTLEKSNTASGKYDAPVDSLSNNFDQDISTHRAGFKINYKHKKLKYGFGTGAGFTKFDLEDLTDKKSYIRNYTNLFPAATFQYTYKANSSINVNYNGRTVQPTINQLQTIVNNNNTLNLYVGNPDLKQSFKHNIDLSHNTYNFIKELWTYQSVNFNFTNNDIVNSMNFNNNTGETVTKPVNVQGNFNATGWLGAGKKLKKTEINLFMSVQFNYNKFFQFINEVKTRNNNTNGTVGIGISKYKDKKYDVSINNEFGLNTNTTSSVITERKVSYNTNTLNLSGSIYFKKTWKLGTDFEYNYREKTDPASQSLNNKLWNAQLDKSFHKDEFTVFFMVRDILNQNIGIDRSLYGNTLTEVRNDRLQRFWMLGFRWDFKNKTAAPAPAAK